jgi:hypothetical protein
MEPVNIKMLLAVLNTPIPMNAPRQLAKAARSSEGPGEPGPFDCLFLSSFTYCVSDLAIHWTLPCGASAATEEKKS